MEKALSKGRRRHIFLIIGVSLFSAGLWTCIFLFGPSIQPWWKLLTRESRRILGRETGGIPLEEKRIREEVILKKMEEASARQDWRDLTPEYPRLKKLEPLEGKDRIKALKGSPEFKEMERELKGYLRKKEDLFNPEPPIPSVKEATDLTHMKDRGAKEVMARLLSTKEKAPAEKPLEENLQLGIKGPLASRKIIERPEPPRVNVRAEAEIELTLWVLPSGTVDRVIPSVKGDAELERIAIQYLTRWRFVSLPRDQPQVEQWGTVPIKFRLQ